MKNRYEVRFLACTGFYCVFDIKNNTYADSCIYEAEAQEACDERNEKESKMEWSNGDVCIWGLFEFTCFYVGENPNNKGSVIIITKEGAIIQTALKDISKPETPEHKQARELEQKQARELEQIAEKVYNIFRSTPGNNNSLSWCEINDFARAHYLHAVENGVTVKLLKIF